MEDSGKNNSRNILVGKLIKSYREATEPKGRRLSQDGLIDLMSECGEEYATGLDRSSISRWESGRRTAPREFLVAFGRALNIPKSEMDGILDIAGYASLRDEEQSDMLLATAQRLESQMEILQRDIRSITDSSAVPPSTADTTSAVLTSALWNIGPPGIYALVVGFVLNAMDLNGTLALLAYVVVSLAIVVGQAALRWLKPRGDRSEHDHIVDLFFISIFFTLNASLLIGVLTKSDHFGFYTLESFTNTPMPFLLTLLVNLALALVASVMFNLLYSRQYGSGDGRSAFSRAVWTTLPPILFVYANIVIFTNLGAWIYFTVVLGILFGAFTTIVALNEPGIMLRDVDFVFKAAVVVITLLCAFGVAAAYMSYLEPDIAITAAFVRIIPLPEVSPQELGYADERGVELLRMGSLWMSLATIVYLATVVGGYLIVTIRRVGSDDRNYSS